MSHERETTKASELVLMLQEAIKEHGDMPVRLPHFFSTELRVEVVKGDDVIYGGLINIQALGEEDV